MIAGDIYEGNVQKCDDILKVWVGKVSTSNNQFHVTEMSGITKTIKPFYHFIADCKDFHCAGILP